MPLSRKHSSTSCVMFLNPRRVGILNQSSFLYDFIYILLISIMVRNILPQRRNGYFIPGKIVFCILVPFPLLITDFGLGFIFWNTRKQKFRLLVCKEFSFNRHDTYFFHSISVAMRKYLSVPLFRITIYDETAHV